MRRNWAPIASAAYREGNPEAVAARYRLHFKPALNRPEDYEKLMATMKKWDSSTRAKRASSRYTGDWRARRAGCRASARPYSVPSKISCETPTGSTHIGT